jgi:hypothetical protein
MDNISYQIIKPNDEKLIKLIAGWYLQEWKIDTEKTINKLSNFPINGTPFQIIMMLNNTPIATGGIYHHVGLLDIEPKFKAFGPWLALVFTTNENRNQGYGALLCQKIQQISNEFGLNEIFLFTHAAETLYRRLEWQQLERINLRGRDIVVMKKELASVLT